MATNLSKNFTLEELSRTSSGLPNSPSKPVIQNLQALVSNILQPLRDHLGKSIHINSGYRSPEVNKAIGGATNSQHTFGEAADIVVEGFTPQQLAQYIDSLNLPFDQLIQEPTWVHVSFRASNNRHERLIATKVNGKMTYTKVSKF